MPEATPPDTRGQSPGATTMREELSNDATRLAHTATAQAERAADNRKEQATGAAHAVSSAIDKAAGALRDDDKAPDWLTTAFEKTARQIEDLARSIEGKDVADIRREVTGFARRSPVAFLAASAAAGFVAARFLRAGSEYQAHEDEKRQSFSSGASGTGSSGTGFGTGSTSASRTASPPAGSARTTWPPASSPLESEGAMS